MARNTGLEELLVDLNDFKEEIHKYKPYEAAEFLGKVFGSDQSQTQAFLLQGNQFKESLYHIVRTMETDPDAMVNPQYLKAYADHLQLVNEMAQTLKGSGKQKKEAPKAGSFSLNYLTDTASLERMKIGTGKQDDDDEFGNFEGDEPQTSPTDIIYQESSQQTSQNGSSSAHPNRFGITEPLNLSSITIPMNTNEVMQSLLKPTVQNKQSERFKLPDFSKGDPFQKKSVSQLAPVNEIPTANAVAFPQESKHPTESIFDIDLEETEDGFVFESAHQAAPSVMDLPTLPVLIPRLEGQITLQDPAPVVKDKEININDLISINKEEFEHQRPAQSILQSLGSQSHPINSSTAANQDNDDEFEFAQEHPATAGDQKPNEGKQVVPPVLPQPPEPQPTTAKLSIFDLNFDPDDTILEATEQIVNQRSVPQSAPGEPDLLDVNAPAQVTVPVIAPAQSEQPEFEQFADQQPSEATAPQPVQEQPVQQRLPSPKPQKIVSIFELDGLDDLMPTVNQQMEELPPIVISTEPAVRTATSFTNSQNNLHLALVNSDSLNNQNGQASTPLQIAPFVVGPSVVAQAAEQEDDGFDEFNSGEPVTETRIDYSEFATVQPTMLSGAQELSIFEQQPVVAPAIPISLHQTHEEEDDFEFVEATDKIEVIPEPVVEPAKPVIKLANRTSIQQSPKLNFQANNINDYAKRCESPRQIRATSSIWENTTAATAKGQQCDSPNPNMFHSQIRVPSKVKVIEGLEVEMRDDWRKLYSLNKFECSQKFYRQLKDELEQLDLFELSNFIKEELKKVEEITQLSETYSRVVEEQEERQVTEVLKTMKARIAELRRDKTEQIAALCLARNGVSLSAQMSNKVIEQLPEYEEIYKRIIKSIKNPQKRLESFLQLSLVAVIFGSHLQQKCKNYKSAIERAMKSIEELKQNFNEVTQQQQSALCETVASQNFQKQCASLERLYFACNRLYEVVKILEGASNLKFRLNKLRTDLNNIYTSINCKQPTQVPLIGQSPTPVLLEAYFPIYVQYMQAGAELRPENIPVCRICLVGDETLRGANVHEECQALTL